MNNDFKVFTLDEIENLKVHGRNTGNLSPLALFWTGSGIEVNIRARELWMEVEVDYDIFEQWITVEINGEFVSRQMLNRGKYFVCVFRGMNSHLVKNVRIYKEVQPMVNDNNCIFLIHSLKTDGTFEIIEDKKIKIEFIGDSITSAEGSVGAKIEQDWIPMWFGCINNYAVMTARKLDADFRIIAQSGWGVLSSWDNNPNYAIPNYYEKICSILKGNRNKELGTHADNDFVSWQPDIIVVNLGTNDESAFNSPQWQSEDNHETFKQHLNDDGTYNEDDLRRFEEAVIRFLFKLRLYNSNSKIIWCYGMLGSNFINYIDNAINRYKVQSNDNNVILKELPNTTEETVGARSHPGVLSHYNASKELIQTIKYLLNY